MGLLTKIFGRKTQDAPAPSLLPVPATTSAPVPSGEWHIVVDPDGHTLTDRAPAPGDMLARAAVFRVTGNAGDPYYAGTVPAYDPKNYATNDERIAASIDFRLRSERNIGFLNRALFLISQSDDGRRLLYKMKQDGFKLAFDHDRVKNEAAVGLCDYANKLIPLAEGRSAEEVVLTLKHELQHMEDIRNGLASSRRDTLHARTAADRVLEGNARVSEAVTAAEIYLGSPSGPPGQFRTAAIFAALWQGKPEIAAAAVQRIEAAKQGQWGIFAAHVLPAYYQMKSTLTYYDQRMIKNLCETIPDIRTALGWIASRPGSNEAYQSQRYIDQSKREIAPILTEDSWTQERLMKAATIRGAPYLDPSADYTAPAYTGLTAGAAAAHQQLVEQITLLDEHKAAGLHLPPDDGKPQIQMPNPFAVPMGAALKPEPAFVPIVMPARTDGAKLTNGQRTNAFFSENIAAGMKEMRSGRTETDRLHFVISDFLRNRTSNLRGRMCDLVDAGLLAPIGCFPDEYLQDLYGRISTDAQTAPGSTNLLSAVMPAELRMIEHWRAIAANGLDPVWIDKNNRNASIIGDYDDINYWADRLRNAIVPAALLKQESLPRPAAVI